MPRDKGSKVDRSSTVPSDVPFNPAFAALRERLEEPGVNAASQPASIDRGSEPQSAPTGSIGREKIVLRREKKGHGGKTVTRVSGVERQDRDRVLAVIKRQLSVGARVEDDDILVQGAQADRIEVVLRELGAKRVIIGS
ncbi:MAG: translation initiation factor [Myxococcales bacterium]|nr:translation initiation factor [Myxococcales bacterium]